MPNKDNWNQPGIRIYKRHMPADVYRLLLIRQGEIKAACNCQISLETTIYKMIRAAKDLPLTPDKK
jgi:hypothetical protein